MREKQYPKRSVKMVKHGKYYNVTYFCNNISYNDFTFKDEYIWFKDSYKINNNRLTFLIKWKEKYMYQIFNSEFNNLSIHGDACDFHFRINLPNIRTNAMEKYLFKEEFANISYICILEGSLDSMYRFTSPQKHKKHTRKKNVSRSKIIYTTSSYYAAHPYQGGLCTPK